MSKKVSGNEYRITTVCVDSYEDQVLRGRFFNPYHEQGEKFSSLMQFLLKMEDMLNAMDYPQSFATLRSFSSGHGGTESQGLQFSAQRGGVATFHIRILFRQNASWQGCITWLEEGREESFRSVLELVNLMNSALESVAQQTPA